MQQNTDKGQDNFYRYSTTTFSLQMSVNEQGLKITLKDFIDWAIYEKQYTEQDIGGGQIHKKVDLFDIYTIICGRIGLQNDEKNIKSTAESQQEINQYCYGKIIKNNGINCYKIQRGGKITVYLKLNALDIKKQMNCDSNLHLDKIRDMNEIQILTQKSQIDKKIYKNTFEKKMQSLIKQNMILKQTIKENEQKIIQKIKKYDQNFQNMKQEIIKIKRQVKQTNQQLKKQKQKLMVKDSQQIAHIRRLENIFLNWNFVSKFKVTTNNENCKTTVVEYVGQDGAWTNYIFNQVIYFDQVYVFKVRIVKTKQKHIMIGVVDYSKQKQKRSSYNSNNAITYYFDGRRWPGAQQAEGSGFKQGQTVEISVSLSNKLVRWSVDGQQRASLTHQILGDKSRVFVPYVQLDNTNDIIQFTK